MNLQMSPAPHVHSPQSTRALMLNVIVALLPCAVAGIVFFGRRALLLMLVGVLSAVLAECAWQKLTRKKVLIGDLSAVVTGLILAMNLPSRAPWWIAALGSAFAIVIVKGLFGGLGGNFLNPALAARAMLLASWPRFMTAWCAPSGWNAGLDAVSTATPLVSPGSYSLAQMALGSVPGAIGETCKLAILIGFAFLLITKTIAWRVPVTMLAATFLGTLALGGDPAAAVLSGGVMFAAVYMATDYVTCPMSAPGQFIYAAGAGLLVAVIRRWSIYPEGATYAVLLMNIAAPALDLAFSRRVYGHEREAKRQNG